MPLLLPGALHMVMQALHLLKGIGQELGILQEAKMSSREREATEHSHTHRMIFVPFIAVCHGRSLQGGVTGQRLSW